MVGQSLRFRSWGKANIMIILKPQKGKSENIWFGKKNNPKKEITF